MARLSAKRGGIAANRAQLLDAGNRSAISTSQASGVLMVRPGLRRPGCCLRGSILRCPQR
jgi:hypothetical protein